MIGEITPDHPLAAFLRQGFGADWVNALLAGLADISKEALFEYPRDALVGSMERLLENHRKTCMDRLNVVLHDERLVEFIRQLPGRSGNPLGNTLGPVGDTARVTVKMENVNGQ